MALFNKTPTTNPPPAANPNFIQAQPQNMFPNPNQRMPNNVPFQPNQHPQNPQPQFMFANNNNNVNLLNGLAPSPINPVGGGFQQFPNSQQKPHQNNQFNGYNANNPINAVSLNWLN